MGAVEKRFGNICHPNHKVRVTLSRTHRNYSAQVVVADFDIFHYLYYNSVTVAISYPDVFHYSDYRIFLKDYDIYMQSLDPHYTRSEMSRRCFGSGSRNMLGDIIEGRRPIARGAIQGLKAGLALRKVGKSRSQPQTMSRRQSEFLSMLVNLNLDGSREARLKEKLKVETDPKLVRRARLAIRDLQARMALTRSQMDALREVRALKLSGPQLSFFEKCMYTSLFSYFTLPNHKRRPDEIAEVFLPRCRPEMIQRHLDELQGMGILLKKAGGDYAPSAQHLHGDGDGSEYLSRLQTAKATHLDFLETGFHPSVYEDEFVASSRTSLFNQSFVCSDREFKEIKEIITELRLRIQKAADHPKPDSRVYSICLHLFPNMRDP